MNNALHSTQPTAGVVRPGLFLNARFTEPDELARPRPFQHRAIRIGGISHELQEGQFSRVMPACCSPPHWRHS